MQNDGINRRRQVAVGTVGHAGIVRIDTGPEGTVRTSGLRIEIADTLEDIVAPQRRGQQHDGEENAEFHDPMLSPSVRNASAGGNASPFPASKERCMFWRTAHLPGETS